MIDREKLAALLHQRLARRQLPPPRECRRIREAAGLSRADIARLLGVSRQSVLQWESGACRPAGSRADDYVQVLRFLEEAS